MGLVPGISPHENPISLSNAKAGKYKYYYYFFMSLGEQAGGVARGGSHKPQVSFKFQNWEISLLILLLIWLIKWVGGVHRWGGGLGDDEQGEGGNCGSAEMVISSFISNPASKIIQTNTSSVILRKHPRFSTIQKLKLYNKILNLLPKHKDSQTYKTLYLGAVPTDLPVILPNQNKLKI